MPVAGRTDLPALIVPHCRWSTDTIDRTRTTATQQGGGPGPVTTPPGSALEARLTGAQDVPLDVSVIQPGTSPRVVYRRRGEAITENRGWAGYRTLQTIDRVAPAVAAAWRVSMAVDERRGICYVARGNGSTQAAVSRRDPRTRTWTVGLGVGPSDSTPAIWYDADADRLMILPAPTSRVWSSTNGGANWLPHSARPIGEALTGITQVAAAWQPSGVLLLMFDGTDLYQYASTDGGVTFVRVNAANPANYVAAGGLCGCVALQDGGFGVWWRATVDAATTTVFRRLASASQPLDGSFGRNTGAGDSGGVPSIFEDYDGSLIMYSTTSSEIQVTHSTDRGDTWQNLSFADYTGGAIIGVLAREVAGEIVVAGFTVAGDLPRTLLAWTFGGWTNLEFARESGVSLAAGVPRSRLDSPGGRVWGRNTIPGAGWVSFGSAPQTLSGEGLLIESTSTLLRNYTSTDSATRVSTSASMDIQVLSGGSPTLPVIGGRFVKINNAATLERRIDVCFTTTGFTIRDAVADTTLNSVVVDTSQPVQVKVQMGSTGLFFVWWRRPGEVGWKIAATGFGLSTTTIVDFDKAIIGAISPGPAELAIRGMTHEFGGVWGTATSLLYGRPVPRPTPIIEASSGDMSLLSVGGLGRFGEVAQLDVAHTYGIDKFDPHRYPSQSIGWRSQTVGEEVIVYDCGAPTLPDSALMGLIVADCNASSFTVETSNDGFTWATLATCTAPVVGNGTAAFDGDTLTASGGTDPWIAHNELKGGVVYRSGVAGSVIESNTAGVMLAPATGRLAVQIKRGETTGTWTSGTAVVQVASHVHTFPRPTTAQRYWRILIGAAGSRPQGHTRAGVLALCEAHVLGAAQDWGEVLSRNAQLDEVTLPSGRTWRRKAGPARRSVTIGWPSGAHIGKAGLNENTVSIGASSLAVAGDEDIGTTLEGVVEATRDGEVPVALVRRIEQQSGATWRKELWVYGHITPNTSHSYQYEEAGGDQSARVETLTVEEAS